MQESCYVLNVFGDVLKERGFQKRKSERYSHFEWIIIIRV